MVNVLSSDGFYFVDLYKKLYDHNTQHVTDYLSMHNQETSVPVAAGYIEHLNSILEQFGKDKCFVVINNFLKAKIQTNN